MFSKDLGSEILAKKRKEEGGDTQVWSMRNLNQRKSHNSETEAETKKRV